MQIWKYPLRLDAKQVVVMPHEAELLDMQVQGDQLVLWAKVQPDTHLASRMERELFIVGTGHDIPSGDLTYVASAQVGAYVWHLFDGGEL